MVIKNKYGFFELAGKPSLAELSDYYSRKYYQEGKGSYQTTYSPAELEYANNKIIQKHHAFKALLDNRKELSLLDVGCGEGFCLKYFKDLGWRVKGCDFSEYGVRTQNPDCVDDVLVGDIYKHIKNLIDTGEKFDVVWLDNILEHVLDPLQLLKWCKELSAEGGALIVEVPNDFSLLQNYLYEKKLIAKQFWLAIPDHISYFNRSGLENIAEEAGWKGFRFLADFPIDFNLANKNANYVADRSKGKAAHEQRVILDGLFHSVSVDGTNRLYEALADLGMGRQLIGIFVHGS